MFNVVALNMLETEPLISYKNSCSVLVLSTGYEPMFKTNWKRALTAVLGGRAEIIETHETLNIGTVNGKIPFPTVVRFINGVFLAKIKKINRVPKLTKRNIWSRDMGECQYCAARIDLKEATIDHVMPKSRGGQNCWENVALACVSCNQLKGSTLLEHACVSIRRKPKKPSLEQVVIIK